MKPHLADLGTEDVHVGSESSPLRTVSDHQVTHVEAVQERVRGPRVEGVEYLGGVSASMREDDLATWVCRPVRHIKYTGPVDKPGIALLVVLCHLRHGVLRHLRICSISATTHCGSAGDAVGCPVPASLLACHTTAAVVQDARGITQPLEGLQNYHVTDDECDDVVAVTQLPQQP